MEIRQNLSHKAIIALHCMDYDVTQTRETVRVTPAMEAGVSDHVWSAEEIARLAEWEADMAPIARTFSVALFTVPLLVGSASAECAWVLWGQDRQNQYQPIGDGNTSLDACREFADMLTQVDAKKAFVYSCLPDTVDPCGPKK